MSSNHACTFPEVLIEEADDGDALKAGMKVIVPCEECGETPLDYLEFHEKRTQEMQDALLAYEPNRPLFHWTPTSRRKQIIRYGLRPGMRTTTSSGPLGPSCVCFADSPSWAWALSGGMSYTPSGSWDLWQTWQSDLIEPVVLATPDRPSGLYEVRTEHRVYKRHLWLVGSRVKP